MTSVDENAKTILNYMRMDMDLHPADVIIGHGCLDTRVAERAAQLMLDGYGKLLVFTGGLGKVTKHIQKLSEAETFRDIAIGMGVDESKILLEKKSTYTVRNILNTLELLKRGGITPSSIIAVTKPYMERRLYATYMKQWPGATQIDIMVTSPKLSFDEHVTDSISKDLFINIMVGDLQRIMEFPARGFQIKQEVPDNVRTAYDHLIAAGYTKHLIDF